MLGQVSGRSVSEKFDIRFKTVSVEEDVYVSECPYCGERFEFDSPEQASLVEGIHRTRHVDSESVDRVKNNGAESVVDEWKRNVEESR